MVFIFFTTIVFIAELIIVFAVLFNLIKFDAYINKTNELLVEAKPKIQDVMELVHGISEQIRELTPIWVEKFRKVRNELVRKQLESLMSSVLVWCINLKVIKYIKKSKFAKFAWKGLTLLQNML